MRYNGKPLFSCGLAAVSIACSSPATPSVATAGDSFGAAVTDAQAAMDSAAANDGADVASSGTTKADASNADANKGDTAKADTGKADAKADSVTQPPTVCGDKFCGDGEDCLGCEYDCGPCKVQCGDGQCGPTETCSSCPADCGKCAFVCGNGQCEPQESCKSCEGDCGACPGSCGDGSCDPGEDCDGCPGDCGPCSAVPCDPFTSAGCKPNEQCFPYSLGELVCIGAGPAAKGQPCKYLVDCQKGLLCISDACREICDASGQNAAYGCAAGQSCQQIGQPGKPSAASGVCM
jgi:hypothetical protein